MCVRSFIRRDLELLSLFGNKVTAVEGVEKLVLRSMKCIGAKYMVVNILHGIVERG